jgi:hypothetical protein
MVDRAFARQLSEWLNRPSAAPFRAVSLNRSGRIRVGRNRRAKVKIRTSIVAASLLALGACGSSDDEAGGNSAGGASGGAQVNLEPGEWEMTLEVLNVRAPNLPPAVAASMKRAHTPNRSCMTPEKAQRPRPETFLVGPNANCKQEGFVWGGGQIRGKTTCKSPDGQGSVVLVMDGTYNARAMNMSMKADTERQGVKLTSEMRLTGRRIGACPAVEQNS